MLNWNKKKQAAYEDYGGRYSYKPKCFDYWTDEDGVPKHDEYTGDDEYGNRCFGPSEEHCPICRG